MGIKIDATKHKDSEKKHGVVLSLAVIYRPTLGNEEGSWMAHTVLGDEKHIVTGSSIT